jgi:hypothetical protein
MSCGYVRVCATDPQKGQVSILSPRSRYHVLCVVVAGGAARLWLELLRSVQHRRHGKVVAGRLIVRPPRINHHAMACVNENASTFVGIAHLEASLSDAGDTTIATATATAKVIPLAVAHAAV